MSVIIFIVILAVLILVHEFGHFIVAKKNGVRVDEFGLGLPPKIFGIKKGETEYTLNWIPFGGFVRIFGENPDDESVKGPDSSRSLVNKSPWVQALILVAGVSFNIIFAWILLSISFMSGFPASTGFSEAGDIANARVVVLDVMEGSPAEDAGISVGDAILFLDSKTSSLQENINVNLVSDFIRDSNGSSVTVLFERDGDIQTTIVTPAEGVVEGRYAIGITMDMIGMLKLSPPEAIWEGGRMTIQLIGAVAVGFGSLIVGVFTGSADFANISGPIGIAGLVDNAAAFGFIYLLGFTAFISINLAVLNLMPFPALDGGRLLFLLIEGIKGSKIKHTTANILNGIGFALLMILMFIVTIQDIVKLF
ncbi:RIP metalloprotease RseP [Candidatus Wolfebacteria bacterium]|nr:MAG: RIP metalloprotease RseP [Candidatus Wolfebacteria bacterium]